jgi:predicted RNA methylase
VSAPRTLEDVLLAPVREEIERAVAELGFDGDHAVQLELLEAAACWIASLDLDDYRALGGGTGFVDSASLHGAASGIVAAIEATAIPPPLALTALAREPLEHSERRRGGCYYTDFRLARFLAERAVELKPLERGDLVVDPASGTGILLAATALAAFGGEGKALDDFVRHSACAVDLSPAALRGVTIALTSLARDLSSVEALSHRLLAGDSLVGGFDCWRDVAPDGFDLVIGNPPWEKLKITRHEHLAAFGALRHYGDDYEQEELDALQGARSELADYVRSLEYELAGKGEPDLYRLFLALSSGLVRDEGQVAMLVPAGLIRSQGTRPLREYLLSASSELRISVLDNRARFFSIDTRFKFLTLHAIVDPLASKGPLKLEHASGTDEAVETTGATRLGRRQLRKIRADLSVPEVRTDAEWRLFRRLSTEGVALGSQSGPWRLQLSREVDMTNDRHLFERARSNGELALIEGRMVHQFRHTAKAYLDGTGRRANWAWQAPGEGELKPQFFVDPKALPDAVRERISHRRVGFCDITGQTNERSMLAASIPAGVACGNKVPTISFDEMPCGEELAAGVFLALANSLAFDWLLRRVLTTTVNYFLLLSVPLPRLDLDAPSATHLADLAHEVERRYESEANPDGPALSTLRAEIDALVMGAYEIDPAEAEMILDDFPLLDRGQPALPGEPRSTITRDFVLLNVTRQQGGAGEALAERVDVALAAGAEPYVPSQLAKGKRGAADLTVA